MQDQSYKSDGVPTTTIRASGGGSQSDAVIQIAADIFGIPIELPHTHETSVLGAAINVAVGLDTMMIITPQ